MNELLNTEGLKVKAAWSFWNEVAIYTSNTPLLTQNIKDAFAFLCPRFVFWQCHFWRSVEICAPRFRHGLRCSLLSGQMGETNTDMFNYAFYSKLLKSSTVYTCKHLSSCPPASSLANPSVGFCHKKTERDSKRALERLVLCFYNMVDLLKWSFKVLVPCIRCLLRLSDGGSSWCVWLERHGLTHVIA